MEPVYVYRSPAGDPSEVVADEKERAAEGLPQAKEASLDIYVMGKQILDHAVKCLKTDKERINLLNKEWRHRQAESSETQYNQYIPFLVDGAKGEELIYISTEDLFKEFHIVPQMLKNSLAPAGFSVAMERSKREWVKILFSDEPIENEMEAARKLKKLFKNFVDSYQVNAITDKACLARTAILLHRPISEAARKGLQIAEGFSYRPIQGDDVARSIDEYMQRANYRQLVSIRMALSTTSEREPAETVERNVLNADRQVLEWVMNPEKLTLELEDICALQRLLCAGLNNNGTEDTALGRLREEGQESYGAGIVEYAYVRGKYVADEMKQFCLWLRVQMHNCRQGEQSPIIVAAQAAQRLASLHPFRDGNGRVSRMVMDFILQKFGLPPAAMRDAEMAVFAKLSDEQNMKPDEALNKVRLGIIQSCMRLGLPFPFA